MSIRTPLRVPVALALLALFVALPAHALFKVVGPDGKVTYTDRLPGPADGRTTPLGNSGSPVAGNAALPAELRQAVARYPVTLYVIAGCAPCDSARGLLRQRGVPHAEKQVLTEEDAEALQRLTGARDAPALMIGVQALRGLAADSWNAYLDAAGYPRESRLPVGYEYPPATPLTQKREPVSAASAPSPSPARDAVAPTPSGIRF